MEKKYAKGTSAGIKGVDYQLNLLSVFLLNALQKLSDWKLSTENKDAGKFDDIVLESGGDTILVQAKHKEKRKKISLEELTSTNPNKDDFSLPKYFLSYQEVKNKFTVKNLIICTNAFFGKDILKYGSYHNASPDSMLCYDKSDTSFFAFNDKIMRELKQKVKTYHNKKTQSTTINKEIITDQNLKEFLAKLQFYTAYPSDENFQVAVQKILENFKPLWGNIASQDIYLKIKHWYEQIKGLYITENMANAIFCEIKSDNYCELLENYDVRFDNKNFFSTDKDRIYHVPINEGYLLQVLQFYQVLKNENRIKRNKILFFNPEDSIYVHQQIIKAFETAPYTHMVMVCPKLEDEDDITDACNQLRDTLEKYQYKKIISLAETNNKLTNNIKATMCNYCVTGKTVLFEDFSEDTKHALLKRNIIFQESDITLEELFTAQTDYENRLDISTLEKLVRGENIYVGSRVPVLDPNVNAYYINRDFMCNMDGKDKKCSEDYLFYVNEKSVLISDGAGTGKSTVLTKLAMTIKEEHPHLWVIKIELGEYTSVLKQFFKGKNDYIPLRQLLDSVDATKLKNKFEEFVFSLDEKIVLMFDGVDEISPDYTKLILNLLGECRDAPNVAKMFVTTRPHINSELQDKLPTTRFELQPFTEENQIDFLTSYWQQHLNISEENQGKCYRYAEKLIQKMLLWIKMDNYNSHFTTIPLHVRMVAEIFQDEILKVVTVFDMEPIEPKLPDNINLTELYDMFVEKKREVFIDKGNPYGNTSANLALAEQFEKCIKYHQALALEVVLGWDMCELFSCSNQNQSDVESNILKMGIVQKLRSGFSFVHRTFAEYFMAASLLSELQLTDRNVQVEELFFEDILIYDDFGIVRAFLDNSLDNVMDSLPDNVFKNYQVSRRTYDSQTKLIYSNLIHFLANEGCTTILKFLFKCVDCKIVTDQTDTCEDILATDQCIGNVLNLLQLILEHCGVNILDQTGNSPLHYSAAKGHQETVEFLLSSGADVNINNRQSATPLHHAVEQECFEVLLVLVNHGANMKVEDIEGSTPLFQAIDNDSAKIAAFIFESILSREGSTTIDAMVLHAAAYLGRLDVLEASLQHGADVNAKIGRGENLIFGAARGGQLEIITYLVGKGANLNSKDNFGNTALYIACRNKRLTSTVKLLVELGAEVDSKNILQDTPLHRASQIGIFDTVKVLVEQGASLTIKDEQGRAPLCLAVLQDHRDLVMYLADKGTDINATDNVGCTVLHLAATEYLPDMVRLLVDLGVNLYTTNDEGFTALHSVALQDRDDMAKLLVELGMGINVKDKFGRTALHLAVQLNNKTTVQSLLTLGAKANVVDKDGRTPLDLAASLHHEDTAELLLAHGTYVNIKELLGKPPLKSRLQDIFLRNKFISKILRRRKKDRES